MKYELLQLNRESPDEVKNNIEYGAMMNTSRVTIDPNFVDVMRKADVALSCREYGVIPLFVDESRLVIGQVLYNADGIGVILDKLVLIAGCGEFKCYHVSLEFFRRDFRIVFGDDPGDYSECSSRLLPELACER